METKKVRVSLLEVLSYWNVFWNQEKLLDNLQQLKRSRRKRQRDSEILLVDHWLHWWWSANPPPPTTPRKKTKPQSPKSDPKTAIGADFVKKGSGDFFFPSIFALLLYCSKLRWHVCFGAFFWCLSCSVKGVSTAASSSSGSSSLEIDCRSFRGCCGQSSTRAALQQKKWT
jgi:hypothetical protein